MLSSYNRVAAGFPCQPFSVCGEKKGFADERGNLFFEIIRAVDKINPSIVFLENVANLTEHDNGKTFNVIHSELASRDYVIRYLIADAVDYGVPQHRTRSYIVAFKSAETANRFNFPCKKKLQAHIFDLIDKTKKAEDMFYLLPSTRQYDKIKKAIDDRKQIYRFSDYGVQKGKEGISFTLKANMGTWYDRVPIIEDRFGIRTITPQECLLLMAFPTSFSFPDIPLNAKYKQCGNSVVVSVIKEIAENISTSLTF